MLSVFPPSSAGPHEPYAGAVWFDLVGAGEDETSAVESCTGLDLPNRDEIVQIEPSARLSFEDGVLRLAAPMIAGADTDHPRLSPVGFVLTPKLLVTVRYESLKTFGAAADALKGCAEGSSVEAFTALMEAFVARQADLLEHARANLDEISHRVFRQHSQNRQRAARSGALVREKLQALGRIGETTSIIRESLLAVDRAIAFALESAKAWFTPETAGRLKVVRDDLASLAMFEDHLLGKVQFLLDAVLGFISIEQNDIFKVLTIASVVGIFPTLVAGWYGMNFKNMPEYDWAYGYQWGIGVILMSTIIPLVWFKWRGWL